MKKLLMKIIAKIRGTFWTDCPRCHTYFFGFHAYGTQVTFKEERHYRIVCHKCMTDHKKLEDMRSSA